MDMSIQPLCEDSTFRQALRLDVREQVGPREWGRAWLTRCHTWGKREGSLPQRVLVSSVLALALCHQLPPVDTGRADASVRLLHHATLFPHVCPRGFLWPSLGPGAVREPIPLPWRLAA